MPFAMETLVTRLNKKNEAIAKRAATTKKHSRLYIKQSKKPVWQGYSLGNLETSVRELRQLIRDRREIENLIKETNKNEITLPEVLGNYRKQLEANFCRSRKANRDHLRELWLNTYKPMRDACTYDIFNLFVNYKYRNCFRYSLQTNSYSLADDAVIADEDKANLEIFLKSQKSSAFRKQYAAQMDETDEKIEKRSAKDAKELVEDLYKRTFGFTGKTEDYSGLCVSCDNNGYSIINGVIRGEKGACKVESISAGGYNIQKWHIRVLVNYIN